MSVGVIIEHHVRARISRLGARHLGGVSSPRHHGEHATRRTPTADLDDPNVIRAFQQYTDSEAASAS